MWMLLYLAVAVVLVLADRPDLLALWTVLWWFGLFLSSKDME